MKLIEQLERRFRTPRLTLLRVIAALAVAMVADGMQWLLGPLGWLFADEIIDLVAMGLVVWLLGFHLLLLPTFLLEFIPVTDLLPTWTGCVAIVIALRKRAERAAPPIVDVPPLPKPPGQISGGPPLPG